MYKVLYNNNSEVKTMDNVLSEYEEYRQSLIENEEKIEKELQRALKKYEDMYANGFDQDKPFLHTAKLSLIKSKKELDLIKNKLAFGRPQQQEDVLYRIRQYDEFPKKIEEMIPNDLPLWFHGCPIFAVKSILNDGEISSEYARLGMGHNCVSLTNKDVVGVSVKKYMDLLDFNIPAGCLFVLSLVDNNQEEPFVDSISFRQNPDQLFAVITSPENTERLKEWANGSGVDASKIHDFDSFTQLFTSRLDNGENTIK